MQTGRTGVANVEDKAGETFARLFGDFATAIYTDSLPGIARASVPARLRFTSRNFRQIFKRFADIDQTGERLPFPFTPTPLAAGRHANGTVPSGDHGLLPALDAA